MERPFPVAGVSFLDETDRLVARLHRVEELKEFILRRLYAAPGGVDDLSHSCEQWFEQGDLPLHVSCHLPPITGRATALPVLSTHRYQKSW